MRIWMAMLVIWGCGSTTSTPETPSRDIVVALNWYPEPEFGGLYEADLSGEYQRVGLNVQIQTGGAGSPVIPQVATEKVAFGISTADEVILARAQGADIQVIFATYQTHPACILVHKSRGISSLAELKTGKLAVEDGIPFSMWLKNKYGFKDLTLLPYSGGITMFLADTDYAQQAYVTSEAILAKKQGAEADCFMISDTGYNPYANVIITSTNLIRSNPELVRQFVTATTVGWNQYLADGTRANTKISELNPNLDAEVLASMWAVQKPLIVSGAAELRGVGAMEAARWETLIDQLQEIGALTGEPPAASSVYTEAFLPSSKTR